MIYVYVIGRILKSFRIICKYLFILNHSIEIKNELFSEIPDFVFKISP